MVQAKNKGNKKWNYLNLLCLDIFLETRLFRTRKKIQRYSFFFLFFLVVVKKKG